MTKGILGKKVGMTQIFTEAGELIPVTVIEATPNVVLQVKTVETDGYEAVQVGFDDKREVLSNKPAKGHVAKANTAPKRFIREFKNIEGLEVGSEITVDTFEAGDVVDVTGTSKGKGFQGVIKRHGQSRGPMAHGSRYHRRPGSMGPVAPNRVYKLSQRKTLSLSKVTYQVLRNLLSLSNQQLKLLNNKKGEIS